MRPILFILLVQACLSYKFLVYSPLFGHSHTNFMAKIADTLTAAGHDVTFLVPIMDLMSLGKKNVSLTKDVIEVEVSPEVNELFKKVHEVSLRQMWESSPDMRGLLKMARDMMRTFVGTCEHVFKQKELLEELRSRKYDVGIAEPFSVCGFAMFDQIGIQSTIGALSTIHVDLISYYIGEPIAPSYVPSMSGVFGEKMSFTERVSNVIETIIGLQFMSQNLAAEVEEVLVKINEKYADYGDLLSKCSFMFTNANPYLNYPRPLIHKTIEIGGITVDTKDPGQVGEKWSKILNERKHSIFISFGSIAKSKDMPKLWKQTIIDTMAAMPHVTFIWKYEETTNMVDHLPNVYLSPWLPQNALLADKRLSIFITHGGLGSTTEVAHLGKPAIMIPLFADQPRNAEMLSRMGGALSLHKTDLAKPELLQKAITTILSDDSYAKAARRLANMLREQPISPRDLVVKHSEFVAKFGPLDNLEPYGRKLSYIQYFLIDVIIAAFFLVLTALTIVFLVLRWVSRKICGSQKKKVE